ncbi:MAG: choline-sulfatase, partial [Verrucomicrobia bacterium]|nr:choline-sulfatase [Verrucomicrobiota bacterium]
MRFSLGLLVALVSAVAGHAADKKPNILFIAIDDQNDWIGYLGGHPMIKTPHIDRLAKR